MKYGRGRDNFTQVKVKLGRGTGGPAYAMPMSVDHRLAVYGTLAPGRPNHHQLSNLRGAWRTGIVNGKLVAEGWGAELGYPALILEDGQPVEVQLFESADLPAHWQRLDAFEGEGYRRVAVTVTTDTGTIDAWIYVTAATPSA